MLHGAGFNFLQAGPVELVHDCVGRARLIGRFCVEPGRLLLVRFPQDPCLEVKLTFIIILIPFLGGQLLLAAMLIFYYV